MNRVEENVSAAFRALFARPDGDGNLVFPDREIIRLIRGLLNAGSASGSAAAPVDYLNALAEKFGGGFADALYREFFDLFIAGKIPAGSIAEGGRSGRAGFLLDNAFDLSCGLRDLIGEILRTASRRLSPEAKTLADGLPAGNDVGTFAETVAKHDRFRDCRTFRFDGDRLLETELASVKPLSSFYGFSGVRAILADHLGDFRRGIVNVPLLIQSLPGYGKTSMTVSYALAGGDDVLVLAPPEALSSSWEKLYSLLAPRSDRRFILFFDDIEPDAIDWYMFRTHVGGAFNPAKHILVILASNYQFPASILSRGRSVAFPVFDELRCIEMVEDFLRDFGLKRPPENLVSLLAADYTESFGQKKFTELSPRTLMRHLLIYTRSREKRRLLADMSSGDVITKPDPTLFYEFNINLMRTLYGDAYIDRLREEKLRNMK
ncbi:MAG: hypothetical protein MJ016_01010 [Victivallaceae bacterium]|nr:hypothetical protein [Victivallaceae bacterium]